MRRSVVSLAVLALAAIAAARVHAETLDELLASRALENVPHPIAADFLAAEGTERLTAEQKSRAVQQLTVALRRQTSPIALMMQGAGAAMSTSSMEQLRRSTGAGAIAGQLLGIGGAGPQVDPEQMQREFEQAMSEPWVRGIGAARALAALGDADSAARFYVACLQMLQAEWVPDACLEDIIGLGPRRAEVLLDWMLENADAVSFTGGLALPGVDDEDDADATNPGIAQLRNAALEGLGALIGSGALPDDARERAFGSLMSYATGRANTPYLQGVAEGLARSRDPRAVEPLRKLAEQRGMPDVRQAALRGLAVGYRDRAAIEKLRGELDDRDTEVQLRAAQALYEIADEEAFEWAVDVITQRRTTDTKRPDIRSQVVRDLVELGGDASVAALQQALADGPGNDWLEAWVAVALLELGDTGVAEQVEKALAIDDWELDRRGIRSIWRAIKPFLQYATQLAMSGGLGAVSSADRLRQASSLIGNAVVGERQRHLRKLGQRDALTAQLRWQAADALAKAQPDSALEILSALLTDPTPGVRSSAALALARIDDPAALALMADAYAVALDAESELGHGPEMRATLVRSAVLHSPRDPATTALLAEAAADSDPAVRFMALAAAGP